MSIQSPIPVRDVSFRGLRQSCSNCSLRELCLPIGLNQDELRQLDTIIAQGRPVKRGEALYRAGEPFRSLYAVRLGFFKASVISEDGREQVTGFHMTGELLGMDAISTDFHTCDAIALEDSEVCELPFADIETLARDVPALQHHLYKVMSREIVRDHGVMLLLGNMKAEERLAAFLLNLSQRFAVRGYSSSSFHLRMTREEIGSYLGLKLETVSRTLSKFQDQGYIKVQNRLIELVDVDSLKRLLNSCQG
ncbi:fumarate/nitrate reduction transcriptional regulator Fnr [Chitinilyticum piscinae]|uniref:Fumarate/nitrate reduction transcriptional regulator Fnr n=1 Tax=Chitinilyticum piscinae TaxID=2866724 RepID=A0A8J7G2C0_9NEIS|nr:fumarate/nitrate reduction transcriptional regulator Fnr [Chitinilyticum piscinae]MBE9610118.1 fumarate/nitrate reduction transcriptional regulator Fnr [Chitinilyticum piscinae]